MGEIEITYSIVVNGVEIGFGSSGVSDSLAEAAHLIDTDITRGSWETMPGMPTLQEAIEEGRDDG